MGKIKELFLGGPAVLKSLPNFVNTFRSNFTTCLLCNSCTDDIDNMECQFSESFTSTITNKKILKEICIKSIVPETYLSSSLNENEDIQIDESFPFCNQCTETVSRLTDLYTQFQKIQKEFNQIRGEVAHGIINKFIQLDPNSLGEINEEEEKNIIDYWKNAVGILPYSQNSEYSNEKEGSCSDDLDMTIVKTEGVDEFDEEFDVDADDDEVNDDEPEEFISPEEYFDENMPCPVVRLERMKLASGQSKTAESENTVKTHDSEVDATDDEKCDENEDDQVDPDDVDDYVPPFEIEIPMFRRVTRRLAKNSSLELVHPGDLTTNEGYIECKDSEVPVFRVKRKYTPRNSLKTKPPKKTRHTANVDGEPDGTEAKEKLPKIKKKRLRKPPPSTVCPTCGKTIYSKYNLKVHLRTHSGEKPYKCERCPMSFYKSSNLNAHMLSHTKNKPHPCDLCDLAFPDKARLKTHKASKHDVYESKIVYECELCLKKFLRHGEMKRHQETIHRPNRIRKNQRNICCSICSITFETVKSLQEHKKTEEHLSAKIESMKTVNNVKSEKSNSNSNRKPDYSSNCKECGEEFENYRALKKHTRKAHPSKNYQCEICGKAFSENGNLRKHLKIHRNEKNHACHFCGDKFMHPISLVYHLTKHTGESLYKCRYCSTTEQFNKLRNCRKHMCESHAETHLREKPFVCITVCFMNFASQEELDEHMKTHDRLKCNVCGRLFGMKVHLVKHLRIHTGERPFKCKICDKTFTQECNLKEHVFRHTGERPFKCNHCERGFLRRKELNNHMANIHPNAPAPPPKLTFVMQSSLPQIPAPPNLTLLMQSALPYQSE